MGKKLLYLIGVIIVFTSSFVFFTGCTDSKQNTAGQPNTSPDTIVSKVQTSLPDKESSSGVLNSKVAESKAAGLEILKSTVKISREYEFADAAMEEGKSGYKWDDGSYYQFTKMHKKSGDFGDIGSVYLVKKNTSDVYVLDLEKDPSGNTLKKYQPQDPSGSNTGSKAVSPTQAPSGEGDIIGVQGENVRIFLHSVDFIDENNGWVVEDTYAPDKQASRILRTQDGGVHWEKTRLDKMTLSRLIFIDKTTGWAVAQTENKTASGTKTYDMKILNSQDGGQNWHVQWEGKAGSPSDCSLWFQDTTSGYALVSGTLLSTRDGGKKWSPVSLGLRGFTPQHMSFVNADTGWVIGIIEKKYRSKSTGQNEKSEFSLEVLKTSDGGKHWQQQFEKIYTDDPIGSVDINFVNAATGWFLTSDFATMSGDLYYTFNAGQDWKEINQIKCARPTPTELRFITPEVGWIPLDVGAGPIAGGLMFTRDGGKHFDIVDSDGETSSMKEVDFTSQQQGWAIGTAPNYGDYLIHTTDGGKTWTQVYPEIKRTTGTSIPVRDNMQASGKNQYSLINIAGTIAGSIQELPPRTYLKSVSFVSSSLGYLSEDIRNNDNTTVIYRLLKTKDSGKTWQEVSRGANITCLHFITESTGFAIENTENESKLVKTTDAGLTWSQVSTPPDSYPVELNALSENTLFISIINTAQDHAIEIYRSKDGGGSWNPVRLPFDKDTVNGIGGMSWISINEGYVLDSAVPGAGQQLKTLYYTKNGGESWEVRSTGKIEDGHMKSQGIPTMGYGAGILFFPDGTGFLGEMRGKIFKTVDGGRIFKDVATPYADSSPVPDFINTRNGYAIIGNNVLLHTRDGGTNWEQLLPVEHNHTQVAFTSNDTGVGVTSSFDGRPYLEWTYDGGKTWDKAGYIPADDVYRLLLQEDTVWAIVTDTKNDNFQVKLLKSVDKGRTWETAKLLSQTGGMFCPVDSKTWYLQDYQTGLYKTTDSGKTWEQISQDEKTWNICFIDDKHGWALKNRDVLVYTGNSGKSWEPVSINGGDYIFNGIKALDSKRIFIDGMLKNPGGNKYTVLYSEDGGHNFKAVVYPKDGFSTLIPVSSDLIYALSGATLYISKDSGKTFFRVAK